MPPVAAKSLKDRNAFFVSFLRNNSIFPASTGGQFIQIIGMAKKMASKVFEQPDHVYLKTKLR